MAAVIESWFRQDINKPVQVHYLDGSLFSNNGNGNRIGVELTNDGADYTVTGTVTGYAVLADGTTVPCTGSKSGNKASILIPPAAYLPGNIFISVFLTDGTTVTTIAAVSATVLQTRTDNQVSPGSVVTDWTNTINAAMQSVETAAENLGQIVATPYSQLTFPVPFGKYTYYNNNLYRCITPIPSSESFTAAHWSNALNLGDEVSDLKSALSPLDLIGDKYTYTASSGYQNVPITLAAGNYKATCHNSGAIITFRDSNNTEIPGIRIPKEANNYELSVTSAQASAIAYIRLYQGSVEIFKAENIVTRVTALESEIDEKANISALDAKEDKAKEFFPVEITVETGYISPSGTIYTTGQHFRVTVANTALRYKISGQHVNSGYPLLCQHKANGDVISSYSGDAGAVTDYIFTPDSATSYFDVNAYNGNGKCAKEEYVDIETMIDDAITEAKAYTDSKNYYDIYNLRQDREARYNLDKKNPFAWKPFDKAYFSWMNDDGLSDMYLYKDLCDDYNIPYANAVPWLGIKNNTTTVDGMTIVNYCKKVIAEGGEIFVHAGSPLTSASTEADIMEFFRDGKKIMEDAIETKIYGIIEAGGSGYSTFDKNEGQKFCLAYYEFSDDYGTTPQYKLSRTRILRSNYDSDEAQINAYKSVVDDAITNHKWVRFYCHSTDETSISVLTSVFNYIADKVENGDCAWTTWKNMYDTFRSSTLENRIKALET